MTAPDLTVQNSFAGREALVAQTALMLERATARASLTLAMNSLMVRIFGASSVGFALKG